MTAEANLLIVLGAVALATLSVAVRWHHAEPRRPAPIRRSAVDAQPHTLTPLGRDGRANPMAAESFANYGAALDRQRQLARQGRASVVAHRDSGEVRVDHATLLGPFGRITY